MRAAYLVQPGEIELRDVPTPKPGQGEVLLRVDCALTCGTDLKAYRRGHHLIAMPGRFGHQYGGRIAEVGKGVRGFEVGQAVMGVNSAPCRRCPSCHKRRYSLCVRLREEIQFGAFAQYFVLPREIVEQNLLPRPAGMSDERAAFLEPLSCVVHGLRAIHWRGVDRVLLLGLGSMGLLFAQLIRHYSGASVVGVGRSEHRLNLARSYGLEQVFDVDAGPPWEQLAGEDGFDCVIECTGQPEGWRTALARVNPGGQVELFGGLPRGTVFEADTYRLHYEELHLLGSFHFGPPDVRAAAEFLADDTLRVDELITDRLPLGRLAEALDRMAAGKGIKYAMDPWSESPGVGGQGSVRV